MQYILTEEEYSALLAAKKVQRQELGATLQDLCTRVANSEPVDAGWRETEPSPWGCIISAGNEDWYCDSCPVTKQCPHTKHWSK